MIKRTANGEWRIANGDKRKIVPSFRYSLFAIRS
jgi:hypothetical protein